MSEFNPEAMKHIAQSISEHRRHIHSFRGGADIKTECSLEPCREFTRVGRKLRTRLDVGVSDMVEEGMIEEAVRWHTKVIAKLLYGDITEEVGAIMLQMRRDGISDCKAYDKLRELYDGLAKHQ